MARITMWRSGVLASGAALALSLTAVANSQPAKLPSTPATEAEIAAAPAAKRLKELLQVVNSGDAAATKAYIQANGVDVTKPPPGPPGQLPLVGKVLDLQRRSQQLVLVRVEAVDDTHAIATVRNKLTGDEQVVAVRIEPQAPHRITGIPMVPGALAATFARPAPAKAPLSEKARFQQIGSYLKRLSDADVFSGVVLIAKEGKPVFSQAYGYADREKKIYNTLDTPFGVASMTKLFTGLAIGKLVEQGKLSYEDPLSKFMPGYPDPVSASKIKIKHLLSHTSGLGDFINANYFKSVHRLRDIQSILDIAGNDPPRFEPGTNWAYSNTGYLLLGRVIEVVSGEDYYEYMRKNVFVPAGIKRNAFPHFDRDNVAMAYPYEIEFDGSGLKYVNKKGTDVPRGGPVGDSIHSAHDLMAAANAIYAGRVVEPETLLLHASPKPDLNSPRYGYGFGMTARTGEPFVGHGGNVPGVCTDYGAVTGTPYTLVVLSNSTISTCIPVTKKILQVLAPGTSAGGK